MVSVVHVVRYALVTIKERRSPRLCVQVFMLIYMLPNMSTLNVLVMYQRQTVKHVDIIDSYSGSIPFANVRPKRKLGTVATMWIVIMCTFHDCKLAHRILHVLLSK